MYSIPVLLVIFKRKDLSLKVVSAIREVKPSKLYIAGDAPRDYISGEIDDVKETRDAVLNAIDWPCEIKTLFRDRNLGCGLGVKTAIDWLFNNEEYGIILEDDCIADKTFFSFIAEMLHRYQNDSRIGMIAGTNPISPKYKSPYSYIFSNFKSCWGWATWKRAWNNMDFEMNWRHTPMKKSIIDNMGLRGSSRKHWIFELREIDTGHVSAWDWQWYFSLAAQNQLCIYPAKNLISNIGNDSNATHTSASKITFITEPLAPPYTGPQTICADIEFDRQFYKNSNSIRMRLIRIIPYRIRKLIKKLISSFIK